MDRKIGGEAMEQICMSCMFKAMPSKDMAPKIVHVFSHILTQIKSQLKVGLENCQLVRQRLSGECPGRV